MKKILLFCGILASLLYGSMIFVIQYDNYDFTSQSVSELSAVGAPTRMLWISLGIIYQILMVAFGTGVLLSAGHKKGLRIAALLILLNYGIASFLWLVASMHQREVLAEGGNTTAETLHIVLVFVTVLCNLLTIGFGAAGFSRKFRYYSI